MIGRRRRMAEAVVPPSPVGLAGFVHIPCPPYNPRSEIDTSISLGRPCDYCGSRAGKACASGCDKPVGDGRGQHVIRVMPEDSYDPNRMESKSA